MCACTCARVCVCLRLERQRCEIKKGWPRKRPEMLITLIMMLQVIKHMCLDHHQGFINLVALFISFPPSFYTSLSRLGYRCFMTRMFLVGCVCMYVLSLP